MNSTGSGERKRPPDPVTALAYRYYHCQLQPEEPTQLPPRRPSTDYSMPDIKAFRGR